MISNKDLMAYREAVIKHLNLPPDSKIEITPEGVFAQKIDDNSFCCGTTLCEYKIKVK